MASLDSLEQEPLGKEQEEGRSEGDGRKTEQKLSEFT